MDSGAFSGNFPVVFRYISGNFPVIYVTIIVIQQDTGVEESFSFPGMLKPFQIIKSTANNQREIIIYKL